MRTSIPHREAENSTRHLPSRKVFFRALGFSMLSMAIVLIPQTSHAITADDIVAIPPISEHYVQRVLDRANAGITEANAMSTPGGPIFTLLKPWWIFYTTSAMLSTVDTRMQISDMQRDLFETTPCLHLDVIILQSKIEKVREEMHTALEASQPFRVMLLQRLIRFLNRRIEHLLRGARDPLYEDTDWGRIQWFDPVNPVWCCPGGVPGNACINVSEQVCTGTGGVMFNTPNACQAYGCLLPKDFENPLEGRLCPFDSDYLPPSRTSFGCTDRVIPTEASVHPPTGAEMSALAELMSKREDVTGSMLNFNKLIEALDAMAGITTDFGSSNRSSGALLHIYGCTEQIQKDQKMGLNGTGAVLTNTGSLLKDIGSGSLLQSLLVGAYETRGAFSIPKNEPWLVVRYTQLLQQWGVRRPQAKYLRYPNEFPPGGERTASQERTLAKNPILLAYNWFMRTFASSWNVYHGKKAAIPVAKSQDGQLQIAEALRSAHGPIERLGGLISGHAAGLRFFTKGYAYYMRRTCMYRSCNKRLEQVLRINFKNECFPYFSGAYFNSTAAHTQCKSAAEVTVSP